jgi:branched-chain amino acid transport system ATP-binding protein
VTAAAAILEVADLRKRFGGLGALDGASFDVLPASITALIGPNGAGKTTAFNVISGFYRADGGTIRFAGSRIDGEPPHRIARRGLVRTFQLTKALTRMSVLDNMLLAGSAQPGERLARVFATPRSVRRRERALRAEAMELLRFVRLAQYADAYAGTLSGGQRKLLEFARALMPSPMMVMLDEPTAGVNPTLASELLEYMQQLRHDLRTTFLLIEHDMEVVMSLSDRVVVMSEGRVIADGPPAVVRADAAVVDAYLGHATLTQPGGGGSA